MSRRRNLFIITVCIVALLLGFSAAVVLAQSPELIIYFSPTCDHCQLAQTQILPGIEAGYAGRLQVTLIDVSQPAGLKQLEDFEAQVGQKDNSLPVFRYGNTLIADDDIPTLQRKIMSFLQDTLGAPSAVSSVTPQATTDANSTPMPGATGVVINAAYIEKDGCSKCARAAIVLEALQVEFPNLKVTTFNNVRDAALIEEMGDYLKLSEAKHLVAPAIYIGTDALVDDEVNSDNLRTILSRYATTGSPPFWEQLSGASGKASILQRFRSMGPLAVVLAALIDGINPCAFATILFFISYLTISKRPRRALLVVGLLFSLGVFVTYLAIGLGAMSLLRLASKVRVLGLILFGIMGAGCLVLAGLSLRDYLLARQGRLKEMTLTLSDSARDKIKKRIRVASGAVAGAAFVTGIFVSLVELACTGQVYLPTISFVIGIPEMRSYATAYLVLYNLIFIFPLILILFLAVYGTSASRVQDWFVRNVARTKLIMAIIFVILGALLLLQVFGVY